LPGDPPPLPDSVQRRGNDSRPGVRNVRQRT